MSPRSLRSDARIHTDSVWMPSRRVADETSAPRRDALRGPAFALEASRAGGLR